MWKSRWTQSFRFQQALVCVPHNLQTLHLTQTPEDRLKHHLASLNAEFTAVSFGVRQPTFRRDNFEYGMYDMEIRASTSSYEQKVSPLYLNGTWRPNVWKWERAGLPKGLRITRLSLGIANFVLSEGLTFLVALKSLIITCLGCLKWK